MNDRIRNALTKTRQFVQAHPTLVVCAATGVVSWKLSHDITTKSLLKETAGLLYVAGYDVGTLETQRDVLLDFITEKGLVGELHTFGAHVLAKAAPSAT